MKSALVIIVLPHFLPHTQPAFTTLIHDIHTTIKFGIRRFRVNLGGTGLETADTSIGLHPHIATQDHGIDGLFDQKRVVEKQVNKAMILLPWFYLQLV
jgi:hypothetical protein